MLKFFLPFLLVVVGCEARDDGARLLDDSFPVSTTDVKITLTHATTASEWRLDYEFDAPIRAFLFKPFGANYREDHWTLVDGEHVEWDEMQGLEMVVAKDGGAFTTLSFTFDRFELEAGYPLFEELSDQSIAVHSGNLNGYLMEESDDEWRPVARFVPEFHLRARYGEHVIAGAEMGDDELVVQESPRSSGSYFYFGTLPLVDHDGLTFLVDPAIPTGTAAMAVDAATRAHRHFKAKLGDLPFAPSILMKHVDSDDNSAGGSAAWGQFLVKIYGNSDPDETEKEIILNAVVHEMSHFWNALAFQGNEDTPIFADIPESEYASWIWEGGAQALTLDAMLELGLVSAERHATKRGELLDLCMDVLGDKRVIDEEDDDDLEWAPYHCGEFLQFFVVDLAKQSDPTFDVTKLWRALFAQSQDAQYDNETFFDVVRIVVPGIDEAKVEALKRMLVSPGTELPGLVEIVNL